MKTIKNLVYGFIVGDAFGLSILRREEYDNNIKLNFNNELNIDKGYYSSMSSFMLATMDSISSLKKVNIVDIMNKMCTSLIIGKYTNNGKVYDIDKETLNILNYYSKKNNLNYNYKENDFSSYSLSRVLPIAVYNFYNEDTLDTLVPVISLTTSNEVVLLGSYIYYKYLINLMDGYDKYKALKMDIPKYFSKDSKRYFKKLLKGEIFYKDIVFDDNIVNVLNIVFYVVLNSDNFLDMFNMINSLEGNTNIYSSLICSIGGILYGKENIPKNLIRDLENKKDINNYIKSFERIFL